MSKEKSPIQKKESSLKHDRRNVYGENPAQSRKNIALGKQRSHQEERHAVGQILGQLGPSPDEDAMIAIESAAKVKGQLQKRKAFKKVPDAALRDVLATKLGAKDRNERDNPK